MLYNYKEAVDLFGSDYGLKRAILHKQLFKIEKGVYSDGENNFTTTELVLKKYSPAFLVKDSALHFIGFIKEEPTKIHIGTARNALRIKDDRVQQHFYSNLDISLLEESDWYQCSHFLSYENIIIHTTENRNRIRLFNLKALFFDLVRNHKAYPKNRLLDLLEKFKDCRYLYGFTRWEFEDNLKHDNIVRSFNSIDLDLNKKLEEVLSEVYDRNFEMEYDW